MQGVYSPSVSFMHIFCPQGTQFSSEIIEWHLVPKGPEASFGVEPISPIVFTLRAAAMCKGPESPEINTSA